MSDSSCGSDVRTLSDASRCSRDISRMTSFGRELSRFLVTRRTRNCQAANARRELRQRVAIKFQAFEARKA